MKNIKKLLALVLALAICAAFAVPALADNDNPVAVTTPTITIQNPDTAHTYRAYQILKGDVATEVEGENQKSILSNLDWGNAYPEGSTKPYESVDALVNALNADGADVASIAKKLAGSIEGLSGTYYELESPKYSVEVPGGYYLIVDFSSTRPTGDPNEVYSAYVMQIVTTTPITLKTELPTLDKTMTDGENEVVVGDKNIGDDINFTLTASVGSGYLHQYKLGKNNDGNGTYKMVFTDTMSDGLTFKGPIQVFYGENTTPVSDELYSVVYKKGDTVVDMTGDNVDKDGLTFALTITDLFKILGEEKDWPKNVVIKVKYTATLNDKAKVYTGPSGENQPEDVNINTARLDYSNNPNNDGEGHTPDEEVKIYTFRMNGLKIDGEDKTITLEGAEFNLYKAKEVTNDEGKKVYQEDGEALKFVYDETTKEYKHTTSGGSATVKSGEDGSFNFVGLEDGKYLLVETKAPAGYNKIEAGIPLDIVAQYKPSGETGTVNEVIDSITVPRVETNDYFEVLNNKGTNLPSTGGIGTTIFYIVGAVLVVGAGVLLFTKRRTSN